MPDGSWLSMFIERNSPDTESLGGWLICGFDDGFLKVAFIADDGTETHERYKVTRID